jgi:hypothetical protein
VWKRGIAGVAGAAKPTGSIDANTRLAMNSKLFALIAIVG